MAETNTITQIACCVCKESKTFELFPKSPSGKHGRSTTCKSCRAEYMREYKKKNEQKLKDYHQARYLSRRDEYRESARENYKNNAESYKQRAKNWALNNPEKRKEIARNWVRKNEDKRYLTQRNSRLANPGYYAAHYKARQQRKRQAMPAWANEESIKAMYRQSAWVTMVTGVKHHVDHYYPLKSELVCGLHVEQNLRIIPAFDNLSKGNSFPTEE